MNTLEHTAMLEARRMMLAAMSPSELENSIAAALAAKDAEIAALKWCAKVADNEKDGRLLAEKESRELRTERDNLKAEVDRLTVAIRSADDVFLVRAEVAALLK